MTNLNHINFCEAIEIAPNTWLIGGRKPESMLLEADVPNIIFYKSNQTLHVIDTGVTEAFRNAILEKANALNPYENLIIHCSHFHADHIGNNSIIKELKVTNKKILMSNLSIPYLDNTPIFLSMWKEMSENFHMLEGLDFPFDPIKKFLEKHQIKVKALSEYENLVSKIQQLQLLKIINSLMPYFLMEYMLCHFKPMEPMGEIAEFYENHPIESIHIGRIQWEGWIFDENLYVMKAQGHSPDGLIFYFPKIKLLHVADETSSLPIWSHTNVNQSLLNIKKYIAMTQAGDVEIMTDGHHHTIYQGKAMIVKFCEELLTLSFIFSQAIKTILEEHPQGLTIDEIYTILKEKDTPELRLSFKIQFPVMPPFVKGTILNEVKRQKYRKECHDDMTRYFI